MVSLNRLNRPVAAGVLSTVWLNLAVFPQQSFSAPEPIKVEVASTNSCAVISPDPRLIVTVTSGDADFSKGEWISGQKRVGLSLHGDDKITRLCFYKNPRPEMAENDLWADAYRNDGADSLRAVSYSKTSDCSFQKWVTHIGDKVLPLGLMSVSFQNDIPPAGTPLINLEGKIVGLVLQPASPGSVYAIPAQAVHRVQTDISEHGEFVRGWMGIALSPGSQIPRITDIIPNSPASHAGLRKNDILVKAGTSQIARYPDAVDALFYTAPGKTISLQVLRNNRRIDCFVTPIAK